VRTIFGLFAKSPFSPLAEHAQRCHETVVLLRPLFEAFTEADWQGTQRVYEQISKLEHKADELKNDIRDGLPKSLFLPVDRGDVLTFLKEQDGIADRAEDVAVLLTMRNTPTPPAIKDGVFDFVDWVVQTSARWAAAAKELPTLQEASFTGPEVEKLLDEVKKISDMEWEADKRQAQLSRSLLALEQEVGAVSIFFWMNIFRVLGAVANQAESAADILRLMLARR